MHRAAELIRQGCTRSIAYRAINRLISVGAPITFKSAGVQVQHSHSLVSVAISEENLVVRAVDRDFRDLAKECSAVTVWLLARHTVFSNKLSVASENQYVRVSTAIATDPHIPVGCDCYTMVRCWPGEFIARTAPGINQVAGRVEFENRGSWCAALADANLESNFSCAAEHGVLITMYYKHMVTGVNFDADGTADNPLVGQWLWPERVNLKNWRGNSRAALGCRRLLQKRLSSCQCGDRQGQTCACGEFHCFCHVAPLWIG